MLGEEEKNAGNVSARPELTDTGAPSTFSSGVAAPFLLDSDAAGHLHRRPLQLFCFVDGRHHASRPKVAPLNSYPSSVFVLCWVSNVSEQSYQARPDTTEEIETVQCCTNRK